MSHKNQTRRVASDDDSDVEQELQNKKLKNNGGSANGYSKNKSNTRRDDSDSDSDNEHQSKGKASQKADRKAESRNNRHNDSSEEEEKQGGKKNDGAYEVIIRGLPYASNDQDLSDFFQDCGEIERVNLLKGPDGRSKGIAFVKFSDEEALQKALGLTGSDLGGRSITIEKTIPKEQRNGGDRGDRNQQRSERDPTSTTVFIGNLSYQTNEDSIRDLFETCGKIKEVRVATDQDGRPRGFGYVEFGSPDSVDKAIGKTGAKLDGRAIRVDFANAKKNDGGHRDGGNRNGGYGGGRNGGHRNGGGYGGDRRNRY